MSKANRSKTKQRPQMHPNVHVDSDRLRTQYYPWTYEYYIRALDTLTRIPFNRNRHFPWRYGRTADMPKGVWTADCHWSRTCSSGRIADGCCWVVTVDQTWAIDVIEQSSSLWFRANSFKSLQGSKHFLSQIFPTGWLCEPAMTQVAERTNNFLNFDQCCPVRIFDLFYLCFETLACLLDAGVDCVQRVRTCTAFAEDLLDL